MDDHDPLVEGGLVGHVVIRGVWVADDNVVLAHALDEQLPPPPPLAAAFPLEAGARAAAEATMYAHSLWALGRREGAAPWPWALVRAFLG